jgi:hypothetical protein
VPNLPTQIARLSDHSDADAHRIGREIGTIRTRFENKRRQSPRARNERHSHRCTGVAIHHRDQHKPHQKVTMNKFSIIAVTATALSAAALTLTAPAVAAPSGPSSVEQTVDQLKADGHTVIVNKVGAAPAGQCTVAAVRPGQTYSRTDSGTPGAQDDMHTTVTGKTVFVDIAC